MFESSLETFADVRIRTQARTVLEAFVVGKKLGLQHSQTFELREQQACGLGGRAHGIIGMVLLPTGKDRMRAIKVQVIEELKTTIKRRGSGHGGIGWETAKQG